MSHKPFDSDSCLSSTACSLKWGVALFEQRHSESGLTLMECVVAIAVVALAGALITPPLFLAAATRVQNRRSEQALQIAQGEIDRIRTLEIGRASCRERV